MTTTYMVKQNITLFEILEKVCVPCHDDGKEFTETARLDAIEELLCGSSYKPVKKDSIFHVYGKTDLLSNSDNALIVSCHVDCNKEITKCTSYTGDDTYIHGTYDNAAGVAACIYAMLDGNLPDNVYFAFVGDGTNINRSVYKLTSYLNESKIYYRVIVTDVAESGWDRGDDFLIDKNDCGDFFCRKAVDSISTDFVDWGYFELEHDKIPSYVPKHKVLVECNPINDPVHYNVNDVECLCLCLPCEKDSDSEYEVYIRKNSFRIFTTALINILCRTA